MTFNGNQQRVLNAIKQGVSDPSAIAIWLDIDKTAVGTAVRRLVDAGLVQRKHLGGYEPTVKKCALDEVWR